MSVDLLIDTHVLLWFMGGDQRGLELVHEAATDDASTVTFSAVSLAEIAVKVSAGKLDVDVSRLRERARRHGFLELAFSGVHAESLAALPLHHRDPFDRMLIAQALAEDMTVATVDAQFQPYGSLRLLMP